MSRSTLYLQALFFVLISLSTATNISFGGGFDRHKCLVRTLNFLGNGTLAADDEVFYRDAAGRPMNGKDDLTLTLSGCEKLCGPRMMWYRDIGPRLSIWLIPILLLISNIELASLDKKRFFTILHLLGDPIDSIWSLVHKIDSWDQCYRLVEGYDNACDRCKRVMATVIAGFEELEGYELQPETIFDNLADRHDLTLQFEAWRRTAVKLADSRTNEIPRTCLAIVLYLFQLVAGFVKEVGGGSNSPVGGRIATGVFLSWLIPTTLLSNTVGSFPSRRTCYGILDRFGKDTGDPLRIPQRQSIFLPNFPLLTRNRSTNYFQSLAWAGGIYTFRPWKCHLRSSRQGKSNGIVLFLISISPVCISMLGAFIILWYNIPTGFNCRHTWLIGIFLAWFLSAFMTWFSYSPKFATGQYHWYFVLVKDAFIAIPSIIVIFLSACGLFNFCYCWSGVFQSRRHARVPLNSDPYYKLNDRTVYPTTVGISVALQLLIFGIMAVHWRRALKLLRWSESTRNKEWKSVMKHRECGCLSRTIVRRPNRSWSDKPLLVECREVTGSW